MIHTLIIPGYHGSETGHWQRHWAADHPSVEVVEQEDWDHPILSDWLHVLEAHLAAAPGAILVAHSLGCALVAHLAGRSSASHIGGALLVAPADADAGARQDPVFADFAPLPTRALPFPSIVVASRNDPYMGFGRATELADQWGAGLVDLGEAGHINVASGYGPWPDGVILAEALRGRRTAGIRRVPERPVRLQHRPTAFAGRRDAAAAPALG